MRKYVCLDYDGKWKNDVFRMFYHMTNYFMTNLDYTLIDTSNYGITNQVSLETVLKLNEMSEKRDIIKVLVIENHDGKLLPDIFSDFDQRHNYNIQFYLFSDDIHKEMQRKKSIQYYDLFEKVFVTYHKPFAELYPEVWSFHREKIHWIPHCVSDEMVSIFNQTPVVKIGLLGNTVGKVYPNRAYLKSLKETSEFKDMISEKAHPSKKYLPVDYNKSSNLVGQQYFNALNKFLCNFTCSLIYGYTVCKYFEIAYTGSLLLCDPTHDNLEELGFIDMKTCMIYKTQSEIADKIRWILDPANRKEVDEIRKAGYNLIRERHMVKIRCSHIDRLIIDS